MRRGLSNIGASVRQRLLNFSRERGEEFQSLLIRYANERLIYRLAVSPHASSFILKGAMLLYAWTEYPFRATQDIDLLGRGDITAERLTSVFCDLCLSPIVDDGLVFQASSVSVGLIRDDQEYGGFRVKLQAQLAVARVNLQVDVGLGDAVTPHPIFIDYPTILDFPIPRMRAYSREVVIAEKFHAMVDHGFENSRMKDFFDIWALSGEFFFQGDQLALAIKATFERRRTNLPTERPIAFTSRFMEDATKLAQWKAFLGRARIMVVSPPFAVLLGLVADFILPVSDAVQAEKGFNFDWPAGGPWQDRAPVK